MIYRRMILSFVIIIYLFAYEFARMISTRRSNRSSTMNPIRFDGVAERLKPAVTWRRSLP